MTIVWGTALPCTDKLVLLALADNANDEGHCWPSVQTLAAKCGIEPRSVTRVMDRLEHAGHLTRHERAGRSNDYTLHPRLKVTPDLKSPLTNGHPTPDRGSPPPLTVGQGTPDLKSPITIIEPSVEPSENRKSARERALEVHGLDLKAWEAWQTYRAERKPAIKSASLVAAAEELAAFGDRQAAVVKHSVAQGYQGLYPPKGSNGISKPPWVPPKSIEQIEAEERAREQPRSS